MLHEILGRLLDALPVIGRRRADARRTADRVERLGDIRRELKAVAA